MIQEQTGGSRLHVSRSDGHTNFLIADMLDLKFNVCAVAFLFGRGQLAPLM
ncbi:hypothetical protein B932_1741 [Gluconobacter oxydans H24]|nr:hypothetical protein B932_1741 [Gluconobacter oxydans H24]